MRILNITAIAVLITAGLTGEAGAVGFRRKVVQYAGSSDPYIRAYESASTRTARGIKGHLTNLEIPKVMKPGCCYRSGVGYSSSNPRPKTCLGVPGETEAVCYVSKGKDGWYATCISESGVK